MAEQQEVTVSRTVVVMGPRARATAELVIKDFETVVKNSKPGEGIVSKPFKVKDNYISIQLYPHGKDEEHRGYIIVFMANARDQEVTVDWFKVAIGKKTRKGKKKFLQGEGRWFNHDACKRVLKNGALIVEAELVMWGDPITIGGARWWSGPLGRGTKGCQSMYTWVYVRLRKEPF